MVKKAGPRLRVPASYSFLWPGVISRNLGPIFVTISVHTVGLMELDRNTQLIPPRISSFSRVKSCLSVKVCEQCRLKSSLLHERGRDGELLDLCGVAEVEPVAVGGEVDGGDDARVGRHEVGGEHAVDREG